MALLETLQIALGLALQNLTQSALNLEQNINRHMQSLPQITDPMQRAEHLSMTGPARLVYGPAAFVDLNTDRSIVLSIEKFLAAARKSEQAQAQGQEQEITYVIFINGDTYGGDIRDKVIKPELLKGEPEKIISILRSAGLNISFKEREHFGRAECVIR